MVDALAEMADEGRGTLRKASVSRAQTLLTGGIRMEKSIPSEGGILHTFGVEGEPTELKHLSKSRKKERHYIP